jgi:hypothetical protein
MPFRTILNLRCLILAGLTTFFGLGGATSQQGPNLNAAAIEIQTTPHVGHTTVGESISEVPGKNARQDSIGHGNPLWSIALASLTAERERPIFSPTRRAPPPVVKPTYVQAPAATQPPLALVGAIAGESEGIAIFLDGTTKGVIRLKTGETHAGWTLQSVKPREAIFQKEQKSAILMLLYPPAK